MSGMTDDNSEVDPGGTSRRDFIRKGAIVGGALVWAVPAVQSIGMRAASAQTVSPPDNPPCDTQMTVNVAANGTSWSLGDDGVVPGRGTCDFVGGVCADVGTDSDRAALFDAIQNSGWSQRVTVDGHGCVAFDLDILEAYHNQNTIENCSLTAILVKAGSVHSTTAVCQDESSPTTRQFTICRLQEVNPVNGQLETKDVSSVTLCLCCHVA